MHLWDPPFCGDLDLVIKRDGTWVHEGKPIRRMAMVQLFASVLKLEEGSYFLVTPVEKVGIQVEDCPFIVTEMDSDTENGEQILRFTTNLGESVVADADHRLEVSEDPDSGEPRPRVHIRSGLNGLLARSVFYRLVELAEPASDTSDSGKAAIGVWSAGQFFELGDSPSM